MGENLWDTTALISDDGMLGRVLHTLVGYTARPEGIQVLFYVVTLIAIMALMKFVNGRGRVGAASASRATANSLR